MQCPKCGSLMEQKTLKEPYGGYYFAWQCPKCGHEQRISPIRNES